MPNSIAAQIDRFFPSELAVGDTTPAFRAYAIEFTTPQFRISLWLALITFASFGIWDVFGENGGVTTTRFRFLIGCPILVVFAAGAGSKLARTYRQLYTLTFATAAVLLCFAIVVLINEELPFKINTGNATINFYLCVFFGYALLPLFVFDGLIFGLIVLFVHSVLLYLYSDAGLVVNSFYAFHILVAVTTGMFVAYWRERFIRGEFRAKREIAQIRAGSIGRSAKIVLSYRRSDSDAMAGRIRDKLSEHFGDSSIFMDIDNIPIGTDFRSQIAAALSTTDILIAVVGNQWVDAKAGVGRRIDDQNDPVRIELETALQRSIPIVPVLILGARMPEPSELPESIREFSFRNAAEVDAGRDFHQHMERLIHSLDRLLDEKAGG